MTNKSPGCPPIQGFVMSEENLPVQNVARSRLECQGMEEDQEPRSQFEVCLLSSRMRSARILKELQFLEAGKRKSQHPDWLQIVQDLGEMTNHVLWMARLTDDDRAITEIGHLNFAANLSPEGRMLMAVDITLESALQHLATVIAVRSRLERRQEQWKTRQ